MDIKFKAHRICDYCKIRIADVKHYDGKKLVKLCKGCHSIENKKGIIHTHPDNPNIQILSNDDHKLLHDSK